MRTKKIILFAVILFAVGVFLFSGKFRPQQTQYTPQTQPMPSEPAVEEQKHNHPSTAILPTVTEVTLAIKTTDDKLLNPIKLKMGEAVELPGTSYQLSVHEFYSHWNYDGHPVNLSYIETNPAVKVHVMAEDTLVYYQWAFKNMEFFGGGPTARHMKGSSKDLLFTLLDYKGFKIPDHDHNEEDS